MPRDSVTHATSFGDLGRLQEIADLDLASEEVDAIMEDLARKAAEHFGLPVGLVSVVLDEVQYFAATHGLAGWMANVRGTPVEWSFCRIAVETREPFVVEDAHAHPVMSTSPLVRIDGVRCYAGIPLISAKGYALGSFCVLGPDRRHFSAKDIDDLRGFADEVMRRIESRRRRD